MELNCCGQRTLWRPIEHNILAPQSTKHNLFSSPAPPRKHVASTTVFQNASERQFLRLKITPNHHHMRTHKDTAKVDDKIYICKNSRSTALGRLLLVSFQASPINQRYQSAATTNSPGLACGVSEPQHQTSSLEVSSFSCNFALAERLKRS